MTISTHTRRCLHIVEERDGVAMLLVTGKPMLIDVADLPLIDGRGWTLKNGYAFNQRQEYGRIVERTYLHRLLMGLGSRSDGEVDHMNRNKLDNRRANLRVVSRAENARNVRARGGASGYRNVHWLTQNGCWAAFAIFDNQKVSLGHFDEKIDAVAATAEYWRDVAIGART